jgi:hypothetical protein
VKHTPQDREDDERQAFYTMRSRPPISGMVRPQTYITR